MQSAMQMQNASRIFTVAPWSGLQQVIHSVEASCMRGEREWKMAIPDGRAITLANNCHSRRAKVVKQGRSRSFGGSCAGQREGQRRRQQLARRLWRQG